MTSPLPYRPEIDGLRALAVIPVVLFHAGLPWLPGGFVGVDVFFVISGYLITSIILSERAAGSFSLLGFYERRVRRILPALLTVMAVCVPFAYLWMLPSELAAFGKSLRATAVFASNILFAQETGYFAANADLKPLLHTWSLAVEEQFYIVFPLLLLAMLRVGAMFTASVLMLLGAASLAAAYFGWWHGVDARFFLPTGRIWELLVGALLAMAARHALWGKLNTPEHQPINQVLSLTGLGMVVGAMIFFGKQTPSPSVHLLLPVVGTALLIAFAQPQTLVGKLLAQPALVGFGLISYSLYLWHQPALAFMRLRSPNEPGPLLLAVVLLAACGFAYLTWRFIEKPCRQREKFTRATVFITALVASAALAGIGHVLVGKNGFATRTLVDGSTLRDLDQRVSVNYGLHADCESDFTLSKNCRTNDEPELMVWGDSFAMHLVPAILAAKPDVKLIQMTKSVCGPTQDLATIGPHWDVKWARGCLDFNRKVWEWIRANQSVKHVVLSSVLTQYVRWDFGYVTASRQLPLDVQLAVREFQATVRELQSRGIRVTWVSPPPSAGNDIGRCLVRSRVIGFDPAECSFAKERAFKHQKDERALLKKISAGASLVDLADAMCDATTCRAYDNGTFMYRDDGHLSYEGAALLGKRMDLYRLVTESSRP